MRELEKLFNRYPANTMQGFTIIELMIVIVTISILASIAFANFNQMKTRAYDSTALTDARNLVDSIINATLSEDDVDFSNVDAAGAVGNIDTNGNPRNPVFNLSPGVAAVITGDTDEGPGNDVIVIARIYHTKGSPSGDPSGRKEYICQVDESNGVVSLP